MANFSGAMRHVKQHLDEFLPQRQILRLCRDLGHRWRKRFLDPAVTVQLFLLQLLAKVALRGLRHVSGIPVTAQAICAAKIRLPLKLLMELVRHSAPAQAAQAAWKGLAVYLADGAGFMTQDTPALAKRYGKAKNQRGAGQRPKWMSKKRWASLAKQELILRQISFRVCRRGFRTQWAWIITTLTDPRQYPARELINPTRTRRAPPRKVKSKGYQFPPLNGSRDQLSKPPYQAML